MSITQIGRYTITGTLGRGAMGIVYQAHDPLIERTVAIKAVDCKALSPAEAEDFEQRFFREAKSAGRLNHPNIVTIHDVGRSDALPYMAMEFLVGRSLRDILDSGVELPLVRIAEIAAEIADGLAFAHANNVVHRDIKPANIMVLDSGVVKITDFGIALLPSGALTMIGTSLGTPKYMSPEQVIGSVTDGRSDIFSLGAVLYEMLTGRAPFTGDNLESILYQVLNITPALPSSINPDLSHGFDRIVTRAMAREPQDRYANAAEMAVDLRNLRHASGLLKGSEAVKVPAGVDNGAGTAAGALANSASRGKRVRYFAAALVASALVAAWLSFRPPARVPAAPVAQSTAPLSTESTPPPAVDANQKAALATDNGGKPEATEAARPLKDNIVAAKAKAREARRAAATEKDSLPRSESWQVALRSELSVCDRQSLFRRILCVDKARRKYCPGHWNSIKECSTQTNNP